MRRWRPAPSTVGPGEGSSVDNLRRAERAFRLKSRSRVRSQPFLQSIPVALSGPRLWYIEREEPRVAGDHRTVGAVVQNQRNLGMRRRPRRERHAVLVNDGAKPMVHAARAASRSCVRQSVWCFEQPQHGVLIGGEPADSRLAKLRRQRAIREGIRERTDGCNRSGTRSACFRDARRRVRPRGATTVFVLRCERGSASSRSAMTASRVPAQVRKSFAVNSAPVASRRYALTSADETTCRRLSSPTYWKSV